MTPSLAFIFAGLATTVAVGSLLPLLRVLSMDTPNARSTHSVPVPRGGGLALLAGMGLTQVVVNVDWTAVVVVITAALVVLAITGFVDDVTSLGIRPRIIAQTGAGLAIGMAVVDFRWINSNGQVAITSLATVAIVALAVISYVNAFNFMDGINGISALNASVCGAWFCILGWRHDADFLTFLGAITAGSAFGFLPWNMWRPRIFLGDAGSYLLGGVISASASLAWAAGVPFLIAIAPLPVYLADTSRSLIQRLRTGQRLGQPHRDHVYQRLVDRGSGHLTVASGTAFLASMSCVLVSTLSEHVSLQLLSMTLLTAGYLALPRLWLRSEAL